MQWNLNNYYYALILNSHHGNINKQLRNGIIPSCKIHMMEEGTLDWGPKGGGKEELGEEEWVPLNTLSFRKTKIWQDYSTSLKFKRGEERGFFCAGMNERGGIYSSGGGNMNGRQLNEGWQWIMNLDLILAFGKIWRIKCGDWWEWGASKVRFSRNFYNSL